LSFDGSLYYIDWKDIQIGLTSPQGFGYFTNASSAKSQGLELSVDAKPVKDLTLSAWVAFNDAKLTADLPASSGSAFGLSGDRLPYSSRISGSISVEQQFPLAESMQGFVRGSANYVGNREGRFSGAADQPRASLPGYMQANVVTGLRRGAWTVSGFVNNLADRRGQLARPAVGPGPTQLGYLYIQPRTVGISLSTEF
jgi:outer membrane receptor protein involved in Fe transport